ncbi:MAG: response regulator [Elusimicrobiota bacterium]
MPKILIIDDDYMISKLIQDNLEMEGFSVISASNGFKGLELMMREKPDMLLLDIMMPGMDGYEVCRKLKGSQATKSIPIIFLSAKSQDEDITLGLEMGADDYIPKPFDILDLGKRVRKALAKKPVEPAEISPEEVDPKTLNFIEENILSYAHWDTLTYFYSGGTQTRNSSEEITQAIGRPLTATEEVLKNLTASGILMVEKSRDKNFYTGTTDPETLKTIKKFLDFSETCFGRLKTIQKIIQKRISSK